MHQWKSHNKLFLLREGGQAISDFDNQRRGRDLKMIISYIIIAQKRAIVELNLLNRTPQDECLYIVI